MDPLSYLGNGGPEAIDDLYLQYQTDPNSVDASWQRFFEGFRFARANYEVQNTTISAKDQAAVIKEFQVLDLINAYRQRGHLFTKTNPVRARRKYFPTLDIENFGLTTTDLQTVFQAGNELGMGPSSLADIVAMLERTYCQSVGAEYRYIRKPEMVKWLETRMESTRNSTHFSPDDKKTIYDRLKVAVGFEQFIHKKFVGQKRFSLEGGESLIPALDTIIEYGAQLGLREFIIGMPHRGRLNVLANVMQKPARNIFAEFVGKRYEEKIALGDVKYHLGYGNDIVTRQGHPVRLNLLPNPSHLETVGALVQGVSRAKLDTVYQGDENKLAPIVIHGDAAVAGQGIVYEIVQMSQLPGYRTGGTIHIVINNQVGFTTNYLEARSSTYSTDVAKVTRAPVFHVNGDDPEAIVHTVRLAMEYRQTFHTDVFIDLLGYRKYGHNEGDEPRFTQPTLYDIIAKHPNVRDIYAQKLLEQGVLSKEDLAELHQRFEQLMENDLAEARKDDQVVIKQFLVQTWKRFRYATRQDFVRSPSTALPAPKLAELAERINHLPSEKPFFKKLAKLVDDRRAMFTENRLDWAMGELLAYASLVDEGFPVRLSGQDSERGTFSHRHAAFVMQDSEERYYPLQHVSPHQAPFAVYNSLLSEYGVLGFDYGYAMAAPQGLTIWEAQFGDFHNVAQVIVDQYISSAEEKWGVMNGLVMLLPHGFEGQGPEHSSARIERFLALAANNNMQVVVPSTPANIFHLLRRQVHRDFRTPLVVFTPKSLLRHPRCVSPIEEFAHEGFREVIDDPHTDADKVRRVVFCSGKVFYDLQARKDELGARDVAIVRIEQLHPFPIEQVTDVVARYPNNLLSLWVQEEPINMGAWNYLRDAVEKLKLVPIARQRSGSPAVGLSEIHNREQREILDKVFRRCDCDRKLSYCSLECVEGRHREEILKQFNYL